MNIERALRNYLKSTGPKVKDKEYLDSTSSNVNAAVNVLFKLANDELDEMSDQKTLDRLVEVLKLLELSLSNNDGVNRKIVSRRIYKLHEKMNRILEEGKKKFQNLNKIESEFNKVRRQLDRLTELNEEKNSKQYDFMKFLITETKNVAYLEYTLSKMPSLVNVRDKEEVPLFRNILLSYLQSISSNHEENILYYGNLLTLIQSQKKFQLSEVEKRKCLEEIYKYINKWSATKKQQKNNARKLELLEQLTQLLKGIDTPTRDIEEIAGKYNIHVYFDEELLEQARLVKTPKEGEKTDRVVIEDYTISMDGPGAIEIDDALTCKKLPNGNYLLGVHIASVLAYFPYESEFVQEAIQRNQSIYLPHRYQSKEDDFNKTIPIFPYDFSADKGSLKEKEPRFTRSYFFEIDEEGNVVKEEFVKSITTNQRQLTYEEVNSMLERGCKDEKLQELLNNLQEVTKRLDKRFKGTELYEKVKENSLDYSELRVKKVGSENIVYQAMLLTGTRVAEYFSRMNLPLLYRVHYVNEENNRKLQAMVDNLNETYGGGQFKNLYQLIEGIYPRGWYAMEGRHSGLDVDHYCHCTSVLRRAADIVVEHALEVCHDKVPTEEELEELRKDLADREVEINAKTSPIEYFMKEYQKKYHHR